MTAVEIAESVLLLMAGVGVFLIACTMMSSNLEALGSKKLKSLFAKTSNNKFVGVGIGTISTAAIQSSGATTVMTIGFVNAGIMTLTQAATVIFGANIGTTITGQIAALGMFSGNFVSTTVIFAAVSCVGAFITTFAKSDKLKKIGGILAGFGMLFIGLKLMSDSMGQFASLYSVQQFFATFKNPFLLVLIGIIITTLVQSSSVITSMVIAMVTTGLITLNQGIYITMGSNIGSCATAILAAITSTRNAKRTSLIHVFFNVIGVAVFMLVGLFMSFAKVDFGWLFGKMFPNTPQLQMSMFHTIFNVCTVIIVLPFTNLLVKLVMKILPDKPDPKNDELHFKYVETHLLSTPPIAVLQVKNEIIDMAETSNQNFNISCEILRTLDFEKIEQFRKNENKLNFLNKQLNRFIASLLKADLSENDRLYLSTAIKTITDLERIGDYAENITEYADKLKENDCKFSDTAVAEIAELQDIINSLFADVMQTYKESDRKALEIALQTEENIDDITNKMADEHIERLEKGQCSPEAGAHFLSFTSNAERIADHYINVAKTIKSFS